MKGKENEKEVKSDGRKGKIKERKQESRGE